MSRKEGAPVCVTCDIVITIKHILTECADLTEIRQRYFEKRDLCIHFFGLCFQKHFFLLLREIGVFYEI